MIYKAKLLFHGCLQNMQDVATNDEFMVSRVFFSVQSPDKRIDDLFVDLKQIAGDNYETGTIEVGKPQGTVGNLDYAAFRDAVEKYYRHLVGSMGRGIRINGAKDIVMRNNRFDFPMTSDITINTDSGGW